MGRIPLVGMVQFVHFLVFCSKGIRHLIGPPIFSNTPYDDKMCLLKRGEIFYLVFRFKLTFIGRLLSGQFRDNTLYKKPIS